MAPFTRNVPVGAPQQWTRRDFFTIAGAATGALLAFDPTKAAEVGAELPTHRFRIRRDEDLLSLEVSFVNFEINDGKLCSLGAGRSLIIVRFPPQNLAEAIFDYPPPQDGYEIAPIPDIAPPEKCKPPVNDDALAQVPANSPRPPVRSYLSGPSWVVFVVPSGTQLPLARKWANQYRTKYGGNHPSAESLSVVDIWLREMGEWKIRVPANAVTPGTSDKPAVPVMPRPDETCLEIPFRVFIAPTKENTRILTSSESPWVLGDLNPERPRELWHAAILCREQLFPATMPKGIDISAAPELAPPTYVQTQARALFSPDYLTRGEPPRHTYYPGNMPLSLENWTRHKLVEQMSVGNGWLDAEHLILTALGCAASLSYISQVSFDQIMAEQLRTNGVPKSGTYLGVYKHRINLGRDTYVIVAEPGFLFPFVYPCFYIELYQRRFAAYWKGCSKADSRFSSPGAYLLKEYYIVCVDPVKNFGGDDNPIGRGMPLKRAVLVETRSPLLVNYEKFPISGDLDETKVGALTKCEHDLLDGARTDKGKTQSRIFVPRLLRDYDANGPRPDGVRWNMSFTDGADRQIKGETCLMFSNNVVTGQLAWNCLQDSYRRSAFPAEKVSFAPEKAVLKVPTNPSRPQDPLPIAPYNLPDAERNAAATLSDAVRAWSDARSKSLLALKKAQTANACAQQCASAFLDYAQAEREKLPQKLIDDLNGQATALRAAAVQAPDKAKYLALQGNIAAAISRIQDAKTVLATLTPATWQQLSSIAERITKNAADNVLKQGMVSDLLRQMARAEQVSSTLETHGMTFDCGRLARLATGPGRLSEANQKITALLDKATSAQNLIDQLADVHKAQAGVDTPTAIELIKDSYWYGRLNSQLQSLQQTTDNLQTTAADKLQQFQKTAKAYLNELQAAESQLTSMGNQYFQTQLANADAVIPSLKAMMPDAPIRSISHLDDYLARGIDGVQNGVYGKLNQIIDSGNAMAQQVRSGLAQPAALVAGLSRDLGALSGNGPDALKNLARNVTGIDLSQAIPTAQLFGVLPLKDIIGDLKGAVPAANIPTINLTDVPNKYVHVWQWTVPVHKLDLTLVNFIPDDSGDPYPVLLHLSLTTEIDRPNSVQQATNSPQSLAKVTLDGFLGYYDDQAKKPYKDLGPTDYSFAIQLLKLVEVQVAYLTIHAQGQAGQDLKPTIEPKISDVQFLGPLKFLKDLQEELQDLLGGGFILDVGPTGLEVGFEMDLPDMSVGVVAMENISIGSSLTLPFGSEPVGFKFNFCTFDEPFILSVMCFAGGGYFTCALRTDGWRQLEGALEFGGALSFNVVVAKGDLFVMAGIYIRLSNNASDIGAFFRAGGHLEVLCLINASVEFLLMLRYRAADDGHNTIHQLYGIASLTVSIDMFMFSIDVSITMEKVFIGSAEADDAKPPISDGGQAGDTMAHTRSPFMFASQPAAKKPPLRVQPPMSYFKPTSSTMAAAVAPATDAKDYRFENAEEWNRDYWSQFAF
jgi:hypothetical protein